MFTDKDITTVSKMLKEAFPELTAEERDNMLDNLANGYPNGKPFCTLNGNHIARIGVRYTIGTIIKGCFYYATSYDNDLLDL